MAARTAFEFSRFISEIEKRGMGLPRRARRQAHEGTQRVRAIRVRHEPLTSGQSEPAPVGLLSGYLQSWRCRRDPSAAVAAPSEGGLREEDIGDLDSSRARCGGGGLWLQLVQPAPLQPPPRGAAAPRARTG